MEGISNKNETASKESYYTVKHSKAIDDISKNSLRYPARLTDNFHNENDGAHANHDLKALCTAKFANRLRKACISNGIRERSMCMRLHNLRTILLFRLLSIVAEQPQFEKPGIRVMMSIKVIRGVENFHSGKSGLAPRMAVYRTRVHVLNLPPK